jgi:hypothetical protein
MVCWKVVGSQGCKQALQAGVLTSQVLQHVHAPPLACLHHRHRRLQLLWTLLLSQLPVCLVTACKPTENEKGTDMYACQPKSVIYPFNPFQVRVRRPFSPACCTYMTLLL